MVEVTISVLSFLVATIALTVAFKNRKSAKAAVATNVAQQFYTPEMMNARSNAWFYLEELESNDNPPSFQQIWQSPKEGRYFVDLYRVISFWHLLHVLETEGELDPKFSDKFFGYERDQWRRKLEPLASRSVARDDQVPIAVRTFETVFRH